MRNYHLVAIILLLSIGLTNAAQAGTETSPDRASDRSGSILFGTQFGYHFFDDQFFGGGSARNRGSYGIRLGYALTSSLDLEIPFTYVGSRAGSNDLDLYTYGLNVVGNLLPSRRLVPYVNFGFGGYTTEIQQFKETQHEIQFNYGAGAKFFFIPSIAFRAEARGITLITDTSTNLDLSVGLVAYANPFKSRDRDRDGIADRQDKCPNDPEDRDGLDDADGCPDSDNDKDGIVDAKDRCPNDEEDTDGFEDQDGCPDPDNDKDGVVDAKDRCSSEAEDLDSYEDSDGCIDPDNDKDGIADKLDDCQNDPEDKDDFRDQDGCPESDNDGDGIADAKDKCPMQPEDSKGKGKQKSDGCPLATKVQPVAAPKK